jgi:hypothetical protein
MYFVLTGNEAWVETVGRRLTMNLSFLRRQLWDHTLQGTVMSATGDALVDRATAEWVHNRLVRRKITSPVGDSAGEWVSLRDAESPPDDEPSAEESELDFVAVAFMSLLHIDLASALKFNHVVKCLPNPSKGIVLSMPVCFLRQFVHHVCRCDDLGDCLHTASLTLAGLADLKRLDRRLAAFLWISTSSRLCASLRMSFRW